MYKALDDLLNSAEDGDYYSAIMDGSWPSSEEILKHRLEYVRAKLVAGGDKMKKQNKNIGPKTATGRVSASHPNEAGKPMFEIDYADLERRVILSMYDSDRFRKAIKMAIKAIEDVRCLSCGADISTPADNMLSNIQVFLEDVLLGKEVKEEQEKRNEHS